MGAGRADRHTGWHDCRSDDSGNPDTDDVSFAATVAQRRIAGGRADPKRIYMMGMSRQLSDSHSRLMTTWPRACPVSR
jgi:hypothetical protein